MHKLNAVEQMLRHRRELASDPHRPGYHFVPPCGWMDDANGLIQVDGIYHRFYQLLPDTAARTHSRFHWGHAVSRDQVHWQDMPIALTPGPDGADKTGCWSGCAVNNNGEITLVYCGYAGSEQGGICLATSNDGMVTWQKHPANPVIAGPPPGFENLGGPGDPYVWREADTWYLIRQYPKKGAGCIIPLNRSKDLLTWDYVGLLCEDDDCIWELPIYFPLGNKHVLTFCELGKTTSYYTGTYMNHRYAPEIKRTLDYGGYLYGANTFTDRQGRVIMVGWSWEGRSEEVFEKAGWAGCHTIPRILSLQDDKTIAFEPIEEIKSLRDKHYSQTRLSFSPGRSGNLTRISGDMLDIEACIDLGNADTLELILRATPDGQERTSVIYDRTNATLSVDRSRSSLDTAEQGVKYRNVPAPLVHSAPLPLAGGEGLNLRVFLDRSILEIIANGRVCMTSRVYPTRSDSLGIDLVATGGTAVAKSMDVWHMKPVWPG